MSGAVFMVPNRDWDFESPTSENHPGACLYDQVAERQAVLVKGSDADACPHAPEIFFVAPTSGNGLQKPTAFELVPRYFRHHRLKLFFPERHLGRLDDATLQGLHTELARLGPEE